MLNWTCQIVARRADAGNWRDFGGVIVKNKPNLWRFEANNEGGARKQTQSKPIWAKNGPFGLRRRRFEALAAVLIAGGIDGMIAGGRVQAASGLSAALEARRMRL